MIDKRKNKKRDCKHDLLCNKSSCGFTRGIKLGGPLAVSPTVTTSHKLKVFDVIRFVASVVKMFNVLSDC